MPLGGERVLAANRRFLLPIFLSCESSILHRSREYRFRSDIIVSGAIMEPRSIETPGQLRNLLVDLRRRALPFEVSVQPAQRPEPDRVAVGLPDLDNLLSRHVPFRIGGGNGLPDLENRRYVNDADRDRDRRLQGLLEGLWSHRGTRNGSTGAVVAANFLENTRRAHQRDVAPAVVAEQPVAYNEPPAGDRVNSIGEVYSVPGSHFILEEGDQTFAISAGESVDGMEGFAINSRNVNLSLLTSLGERSFGLELWSASFGDTLLRILGDTVDHILGSANAEDGERRLISMDVANLNQNDRGVYSGEFPDTPANRLAIVRTVIDEMFLAMNSSDAAPEQFLNLQLTLNVRFPDRKVNNLTGQGIVANLDSAVDRLAFGVSEHRSKRLTHRNKKGQLLFVPNTSFCWAVALWLTHVHESTVRQIMAIEFRVASCGGQLEEEERKSLRKEVADHKKSLLAELNSSEDELEELEAILRTSRGLAMDLLEPSPETFQDIALALNRQIVIVDEACNYEDTRIFPYEIDPVSTETRQKYDQFRPTLFLLRTKYPVFSKQDTSQEDFERFYFHYHGLVSGSGLLVWEAALPALRLHLPRDLEAPHVLCHAEG